MIHVGRWRHRIKIYRLEETQSPSGEMKPAPTLLGERWASIEPLAGRELWAAQQVQSNVSHRVTLWHFPGLRPTDYITSHCGTFNIESVILPSLIREHMVLMCCEQVTRSHSSASH